MDKNVALFKSWPKFRIFKVSAERKRTKCRIKSINFARFLFWIQSQDFHNCSTFLSVIGWLHQWQLRQLTTALVDNCASWQLRQLTTASVDNCASDNCIGLQLHQPKTKSVDNCTSWQLNRWTIAPADNCTSVQLQQCQPICYI